MTVLQLDKTNAELAALLRSAADALEAGQEPAECVMLGYKTGKGECIVDFRGHSDSLVWVSTILHHKIVDAAIGGELL